MFIQKPVNYGITFTSETHNFPTGIAPFPGASTGTGGRIRDNQGVGRGGLVVAATAGYCVGNLNIPNYKLTWEDGKVISNSVCPALQIEIEASNGASDYGNKFGEPVINGFTRSFGMTINDERIEWLKPIMFSGGMGMIDREHIVKQRPELGMLIVRIGGPAYRIGMGGGAASSRCQSDKVDHSAVQRGDPEMENKVNRVLRACIELGSDNPICSIHDQGAGGTANVTKEIIDPVGGIVNIDNIISGDKSLSVLEKWVAEYQEQITVLIKPKDTKLLKKITKRENCPMSVFGIIMNSGKIEVYDSKSKNFKSPSEFRITRCIE